MNENKKLKIIFLLIMVPIVGLLIILKNNYLMQDNVIYNNNNNNKVKENNLFAIMVSRDNGKSYLEYEENNMPTSEYKYKKTICIDSNGDTEENMAIYNEKTGEVKITTNKAISCYLYFDYSLIDYLRINDSDNVLSKEIIGDMYRYQGVDVQYKNSDVNSENLPVVDNNYICFGTTDKEKCLENLDNYMYRIIGYDANTKEIEIIKKEALNKGYQWSSDYNVDTPWPDSLVYKAVNGPDFFGNNSYVPINDNGINWQEMISEHTYLYGSMQSVSTKVGLELYQVETGQSIATWYEKATENTPGSKSMNVSDTRSPIYGTLVYYLDKQGYWTDKVTSKVSVMSLSDYSLAVSNNALCSVALNKYAICKAGWIYITNNDPNPPITSKLEYTRNYSGFVPTIGIHWAYRIFFNGDTSNWSIIDTNNIRPTFYLTNNLYLTGTGKADNPYIIHII